MPEKMNLPRGAKQHESLPEAEPVIDEIQSLIREIEEELLDIKSVEFQALPDEIKASVERLKDLVVKAQSVVADIIYPKADQPAHEKVAACKQALQELQREYTKVALMLNPYNQT